MALARSRNGCLMSFRELAQHALNYFHPVDTKEEEEEEHGQKRKKSRHPSEDGTDDAAQRNETKRELLPH